MTVLSSPLESTQTVVMETETDIKKIVRTSHYCPLLLKYTTTNEKKKLLV